MISKGAQYLKAYRSKYGLRQEDLAGMLGCTIGCISRFESGLKPSREMFKKICELTGISIEKGWEIFYED